MVLHITDRGKILTGHAWRSAQGHNIILWPRYIHIQARTVHLIIVCDIHFSQHEHGIQ